MTRYSLAQLTGCTESHLSSLTEQERLLINKESVSALLALTKAAQAAGFELVVASGFRDYKRQAMIWDNKFSGKRAILDSDSQPLDSSTLTELEKIHAIMRWSALPGASRHHWGTEFDVYARNCLPDGVSLQLEPWEYHSGHQAEFSDWLQSTLAKYEFFLPYRQDLGGVACEPWHISHFPVAQTMQEQLTVEALSTTWITQPFLGVDTVLKHSAHLYERYVTNISLPEAKA